jgi:hypothetical protein
MDVAGLERIDFPALAGADLVNVGDLTGTDLTSLQVDLEGTPGAGDGEADRIVVSGTNGEDAIDVSGDSDVVKVSGLAPTVEILQPEFANDRLEIKPSTAMTPSPLMVWPPGRSSCSWTACRFRRALPAGRNCGALSSPRAPFRRYCPASGSFVLSSRRDSRASHVRVVVSAEPSATERQVRVQKREAGPVRLGRGGLDAITTSLFA